MTTMLIANNPTRENGSFMGDQLCYLKIAYLFVQNQPDVDKVVMSMSPGNEMNFLWDRFIRDPRGDGTLPPVEVVWDDWNAGDWSARWTAWDHWRQSREIKGIPFKHYRELYLRIHGMQRQNVLCGFERGLARRNIFEYVYYGQEHMPETCIGSDVYDVEIDHPAHMSERDVYISPHCKTQGNYVFTFDYWSRVVHRLIDAGIAVTVGYDGPFCEDLTNHPLYRRHWGDHKQWMKQICSHRIVACGNTGTGWLAAACKVPLLTMEPPGSQMPDHRYRECGLRNLVEVISEPDADYCARRLIEEVRKCIVMTTGCYDILHAGHVRHLEKAKSLGTRLIVALNSDESVRRLKGPSRPINPQLQRKAVLEALRSVDEVRVVDEPMDLVREVRPNVLAVGFGYSRDTIKGREFVESYGGRAVITYHGDASDEPSTTKIVQRVVLSTSVVDICRMGSAYSVNPFDKLKKMADEFTNVATLQGDVADCGSWRGGTALILRRLVPDKHLHLFDTWEGSPHDDDLCHHKKGEWKADIEECKALVGQSTFTHYHKGIFPHCSTELLNEDDPAAREFCFVYVDMDTYQSTRDAIAFFYPRLVRGGIIMFDDWLWTPCAGVEKAVRESFSDDQIRSYPNLYVCIVEKK